MALLPVIAMGQQDGLYYFSNKANPQIVGVKTSAGKVIIPAAYRSPYAKAGDSVATEQIFLCDTATQKPDAMHYNYSVKVFDRTGNFLYSPYYTNKEAESYHEGLRQYVEKGKMGFVDRNGKKVIPAKYPFVYNFYRGCAFACLDCSFRGFQNNVPDGVPVYNANKWAIINRKGTLVKKLGADFDFDFCDSLLMAYHLVERYTAADGQLINNVKKIVASRLAATKQKKWVAVIAERPTPGSNFYEVDFRQENNFENNDHAFLVSADMKKVYELIMRNGVMVKKEVK